MVVVLARLATLALSVALLTGCRTKQPGCDGDALESLATRIEQADAREQPELVIAGLQGACRFPSAYDGYFELFDANAQVRLRMSDEDQAARHAAMDRACPSAPGILSVIAELGPDQRMATLYDRCALERYEVLERQAFLRSDHSPVPWALHQFMLDHGADAHAAQVVTRALFVAERKHLYDPDVGLDRLPRVDAPLFEVPEAIDVILTTDELRMLGHTVASLPNGDLDPALMDGRVITPLAELLTDELRANIELAERREQVYAPRVHVQADARMRAALVVAILDTAARRGVDVFGLLVESGVYEYGVLPLEPVMPEQPPAGLRVRIDDDGGVVLVAPQGAELGQDLEALRARAAPLCARGRSAVIEVSEHVTVERLVAVALTLRGPSCSTRLIVDTQSS